MAWFMFGRAHPWYVHPPRYTELPEGETAIDSPAVGHPFSLSKHPGLESPVHALSPELSASACVESEDNGV